MNQLLRARRRWLCAFAAVLLLGGASCIAFAATSTPFQVFSKGKNVQVWQRFGQWLMITEDLTDGRVCYFYDPIMRTKLNLKAALPGNWAPLGSAIKWLMYVDYVQQLDRLISHDVDSQAWHITKSSTLRQVGCGMVGNVCVFGEYRANPIGDITPVDLYTANVGTGAIAAFCSSDSEKSAFAHDGNLIVYKARYPSGFTGLYGHYFQGNGEFMINEGDVSEPSVCGSLVGMGSAQRCRLEHPRQRHLKWRNPHHRLYYRRSPASRGRPELRVLGGRKESGIDWDRYLRIRLADPRRVRGNQRNRQSDSPARV